MDKKHYKRNERAVAGRGGNLLDALSVLKAAELPHVRFGRRGAIIWDADAVDHLRGLLKRQGGEHG